MATPSETKVNWLIGLVVLLLVALGLVFFLMVLPIHNYLGSAKGEDETKWKGLIGNLTQHARDVRGSLADLNCRVWMLEANVETRPDRCPPVPPAAVPSDPPKNYP